MAEPINIQDMIDGRLDIKSLGEAANGDENTQVITRLGETYPSAKKAIKQMFENGGLPAKPFATKALMMASALVDGDYALVTNDAVVNNNGMYVKEGGVWTASNYDAFSKIKSLESDLLLIEKGSVIVYDDSAFTVPTSKTDYTSTAKIPTQGMTQLYIRLQSKSSAEIVIGFRKLTNERVILEPATPAGVFNVSKFIAIPDDISEITIIAANSTYVNYDVNYKPLFILGKSKEAIQVKLEALKNIESASGQIPARRFTTYASLIASNLPDNSYAAVVNDDDIIKNGYYFRLDREWVFNKEGAINLLYDAYKGIKNAVAVYDKSAFTESTSNTEYSATGRILTKGAKKVFFRGQSRSGSYVLLGYPLGGNTATRVILIPARLSNQRDIYEFVDIPNGVDELKFYAANETYKEYNAQFSPLIILGRTEESIQAKLDEIENKGGGAKSSPDYIASEIYPTPTLKAIREMTTTDGTPRKAVQYLWQDSSNKFYISSSKRGAKSFIFEYKKSDFHDLAPDYFSMNFDKFGNIICVYRTEYGDWAAYSDAASRKNPIILIKANNYKPMMIDFGAGLKPSAWIQNSGFLCTDDAIYIAEYTRPSVQTANCWKATYPLTDKANWRTVQSFTLSAEPYPSDNLKHMHSVERDPFTGFIYTSTGDENAGSYIYVSKDNGETFTPVVSQVQKYARVLNFVFTKDAIYWATDNPGAKHYAFKGTRDSTGALDGTNIIDLHQFGADSYATYATIHMPNIDALVFLGRVDNATTLSSHIEVWDLKNGTFSRIADVPPIPGAPTAAGFRCECFEYVPLGNEIICGFSAASSYVNNNALLGNSRGKNKVNNMIIAIERVGTDFTVSYDTVI